MHILDSSMIPMIYKNLEEFSLEIEKLKKQWKKIVWTNGCFDILQPWHIETFRKAKEYWDILIVWLNGDKSPYRKTKPWRPINNEDFRTQMLQAIRFVDFVYVYDEETPILPIATLLPDVLIKGGDYKAEEVVGYKKTTGNWWKVVIIPTVEGHSTTNIVNKLKENGNRK